MMKVGINGFGRIGRLVAREILRYDDMELVAVNDLFPTDILSHLFKYDSAHGIYPGEVSFEEKAIIIDGKKIECFAEKDPANLKWGSLGVKVVLECTGKFRVRDKAARHLDAGAKKVIISAPGKQVDGTFVIGVNEKIYDPTKHHVISNASCTTNCLAPLVKVLNDNLGIVSGFMTTTHSYTADQRLQDAPHKDFRRARAAAESIIPTTTGAAKTVGKVICELEGKLDGIALRVPTINVSLVDFVCTVKISTTIEQVNQMFKRAAEGELNGILGYSEVPLVSKDYNSNRLSSILDAELTNVLNGTLVKVVAWYDNEMGYSARTVELARIVYPG